MFKFDFDIEDAEKEEEIQNLVGSTPQLTAQSEENMKQVAFKAESLTELLDALPDLISYSPLAIPVTAGSNTIFITKRDLFDARFQSINESSQEEEEEEQGQSPSGAGTGGAGMLDHLDSPSDLVPGQYEGGFKTWEASIDLVEYLHSLREREDYLHDGSRLLELGCGTAIPSLYVLQRLFVEGTRGAKVHLQDYNASVLRLLTLPNVLLSWYMSPAADTYKAQHAEDLSPAQPKSKEPADDSDIIEEDEDEDEDDTNTPALQPPPASADRPGELLITPELKEAFLSTLSSLDLSIEFFSGSWETFSVAQTLGATGKGGYDVVLTSETIYRTESLPALTKVLKESLSSFPSVKPPTSSITSDTTRGDNSLTEGMAKLSLAPRSPLCLVAAKVLYFGVGGGTTDFMREVERQGGEVTVLLERKEGVGRKIMRTIW